MNARSVERVVGAAARLCAFVAVLVEAGIALSQLSRRRAGHKNA